MQVIVLALTARYHYIVGWLRLANPQIGLIARREPGHITVSVNTVIYTEMPAWNNKVHLSARHTRLPSTV